MASAANENKTLTKRKEPATFRRFVANKIGSIEYSRLSLTISCDKVMYADSIKVQGVR